MKVFEEWSRLRLLSLLWVSALMAGCGTETLRGYSEEFVTRLDLEIVEERHDVTIALIEVDAPSSYITSFYVVANSSEEVKDRLRGLQFFGSGWVAPSEDGRTWTGELPLESGSFPWELEAELRYLLLTMRDSGNMDT